MISVAIVCSCFGACGRCASLRAGLKGGLSKRRHALDTSNNAARHFDDRDSPKDYGVERWSCDVMHKGRYAGYGRAVVNFGLVNEVNGILVFRIP